MTAPTALQPTRANFLLPMIGLVLLLSAVALVSGVLALTSIRPMPFIVRGIVMLIAVVAAYVAARIARGTYRIWTGKAPLTPVQGVGP